MKDNLKHSILEIIKVLKIATITFLGILVAFGGISLIVYKGKLIPSLDIVRSVSFLVAAIGLIVTSAYVMKREGSASMEERIEWKDKFKYISFRTFVATFSITILIYGCIIDYIRYALK